MARDPRPIHRLLRAGGNSNDRDLATVLDRAQWLKNREVQICQCLPATLRAHVSLANIRGDTLVMRADSAAWGTRLRYLRSQILSHATKVRIEVSRLDIRVRPRQTAPAAARQPYPVSENAAASIETTAASVDDPELADALTRLAQTAKSFSN